MSVKSSQSNNKGGGLYIGEGNDGGGLFVLNVHRVKFNCYTVFTESANWFEAVATTVLSEFMMCRMAMDLQLCPAEFRFCCPSASWKYDTWGINNHVFADPMNPAASLVSAYRSPWRPNACVAFFMSFFILDCLCWQDTEMLCKVWEFTLTWPFIRY